MKKKVKNSKLVSIFIPLISLVIILAAYFIFVNSNDPSTSKNGANFERHFYSNVLNYAYEDISESEVEALESAINDEYKAKVTYEKVVEIFGDVRPFSNIIKSEESHIQRLKDLYNKYELEIPENNFYDKVSGFKSLEEACDAGVNAEIENAKLYDELFSKVDNQDIIDTFTLLRDASKNNHLLAFEKCSSL